MSVVNVGTTPNDGTGDDLRTAFSAINAQFNVLDLAAARIRFFSDADIGGVGDNSTLNDTAWTTAVTSVLAVGGHLILSPGIYRFSAALEIGQHTGWSVLGCRGAVIFRQVTDNTPLFKFTGNLAHSWQISDITLDWVNDQSSANTSAIGIYFDGTSGTQQAFHFQLFRVTFDKGYLFMASHAAKSISVWGWHMDDCLCNTKTSGGAIRLVPSPSLGQPSISIGTLYMRCDAMTLPAVQISAANGLQIRSLEGNILTNIPLLKLTGGCTGRIGMLKLEVGTYTTADTKMFEYSDCHVTIEDLIAGQVTCNVGAGNKWHVLRLAGGSSSDIQIDRFSATVTATSGSAFAVYSTGDTQSVTIRKVLNFSNIALTDTAATAGPDNLWVDGWGNARMSADLGDANATFAMGAACIQRFSTTLTANRDFTLPVATTASGTCNSFNGHAITVLRDAPTPGAFTLTIKTSTGATVYTIPSGTKQAVDLVWSRISGGAYRVVRAVTLT